ncbi:hypothetical protein OAD08_00105 [bacterium]|nr:hypothetical protein [bacterium]
MLLLKNGVIGVFILETPAVVDVFEIKDDLIAALVPGQNELISVGDFSSDTGLADSHGVGGRDVRDKLRALLDLELVEAGQKTTAADEDEGAEEVKSEAVFRFHEILKLIGSLTKRIVTDFVSAQICDLEKNPEDDGGGEHGDERSQTDLIEDPAGDIESAPEKAEEKIFHGEVEKHSHSSEHSGEIPFTLFKKRLNSLHEEAHEGEEEDGVAKFHRLDLTMVDLGGLTDRIENLLGIPEKAAEENEDKHSCGGHGGRAADNNERDEKDAGIIPRINGREELLNNATQQEKANQADMVEKHFFVS